MFYYITTEHQTITFYNFKDAQKFAIENGYFKFRNNLGEQYFL